MKSKRVLGIAISALALLGALMIYLRHTTVAVLSPQGPVAAEERRLIFFGLLLSLVVVVPVFVMAALIGWRYRETNHQATYMPEWDHSRVAETIWWGVPLLLITILSVVAWHTSHTLDPGRPIAGTAPPITVQVVALDWKWLFIYPQQNIASVNYVQFPVGAPVDFQITSDAPMNSFWIPQLGGQIYAMPGMMTQIHLLASSPGRFNGASANISGRGFADMRFVAAASSPSDFYAWVAQAKQSSNMLNIDSYNRLAEPSTANPEKTYAVAQSGIFNDVLQKYMLPSNAGPANGVNDSLAASNQMSGMVMP